MKERLTEIFNALNQIETKGQSTLIVADCMRSLADLINNMPKEEEHE